MIGPTNKGEAAEVMVDCPACRARCAQHFATNPIADRACRQNFDWHGMKYQISRRRTCQQSPSQKPFSQQQPFRRVQP